MLAIGSLIRLPKPMESRRLRKFRSSNVGRRSASELQPIFFRRQKGVLSDQGEYEGCLNRTGSARVFGGKGGECRAVRQHGGRLRVLEATVRRGGKGKRYQRLKRRSLDGYELRKCHHRRRSR